MPQQSADPTTVAFSASFLRMEKITTMKMPPFKIIFREIAKQSIISLMSQCNAALANMAEITHVLLQFS